MRRNNLDICADILRVSRSGAKKTHLVYKANLNFKIVKSYLDDLVSREFIENRGERFFITEKGSKFIERYDALVAPLSSKL
ncbi:MAG TPA: winged helix-turn-helix domain-containing protein [Patescibacteria group bacterium]|nr:winged helix-turn-helix domain-containing protein [Patescibacteria group bacterium]